MEKSPAHCTTTGDELSLDLEVFDLYADMAPLIHPSSSSVCPIMALLSSAKLSAHLTIPSAHPAFHLWFGVTAGLSVSSSIEVRGSLVSTSDLC